MNQLSWLLYLGGIASNLGTVLYILSFGFAMLSFVFFMDCYVDRNHKREKHFFIFLATTVFTLLLACLSPSNTTVYAIAASEMGEQALKTPLASKASQALEAWLDQQIKKAEEPSK